MFPTTTNNYNNCYEFSTSDHQLHQIHHQTLPPPYLFPFSPSLVKDVDEFVNSQHQLALLTHQYHSTTLPLMMMNTINDTSSETLADESFETTTTTTTTTTNEPYTNANTNTAAAAAAAANTLDVVVDDDLGPPSNGKGTKQHHSSANYGKKARDLVAARAMKSQQSPRRRSKKDRHSKIVTAQGPRDRRMRLSLDIARRFFNLQDMLHFDKASKTVEWLLAKSRSAIKELSSRGFNSETKMISNCSTAGGSSTSSECEVVSGVVDADHDQSELLLLQEVTIIKSKEKRTRQAQRKTTLHPVEAKESRARARARARERTMERLLTRSQPQPQPPEENPNAQLRSSSITTDHEDQSCEELGTHQSFFVKSHTNKSLEVVTHEVVDHEKGCSHHSLENIIKKSSSASSSSIFNYTEGIAYSFNQNNNRGFVGIDENWELQSLCTNTISNKNPSSTGEVFENYTPSTSCSSSMHNFDTHLQSQFADHNRRFSSYTAKPW